MSELVPNPGNYEASVFNVPAAPRKGTWSCVDVFTLNIDGQAQVMVRLTIACKVLGYMHMNERCNIKTHIPSARRSRFSFIVRTRESE